MDDIERLSSASTVTPLAPFLEGARWRHLNIMTAPMAMSPAATTNNGAFSTPSWSSTFEETAATMKTPKPVVIGDFTSASLSALTVVLAHHIASHIQAAPIIAKPPHSNATTM